jgi:CheY-like chemotaxis protein
MNPVPGKPPLGKTAVSRDLSRSDLSRPALSREDLRVRLLIVDDEQSIRKLCVTVGEALGFICLEADSGESALALLEEQPVHVVLSDMVMPHMSGLEFLEKVKKLLPRS